MASVPAQIKTRDMVDVLRNDLENLKNMQQPSGVCEQIIELHNEQKAKGEVIKGKVLNTERPLT